MNTLKATQNLLGNSRSPDEHQPKFVNSSEFVRTDADYSPDRLSQFKPLPPLGSTRMSRLLNVRKLIGSAAISLLVAQNPSSAQGMFDFARTKTDSSETFLVYDFPGFSGSTSDIKSSVREALTYQGDNAFIKDNLQSGEPPRYPAKLMLKPLGINLPVSISIPSCEGSAFTVSSSDNSMAKYGDSSRYIACGFPYAGGFRVNFYAHYATTNGGVFGLISGKTVGKIFTDAVGLSSDPQKFIESSIAKMEELFNNNGWKYSLVEMNPAIPGKVVSADPLVRQQVTESKRTGDRSKRMAARGELGKLGIDASDRARFQRAVQSDDEDLVALFVEAGAIDIKSRDSDGKVMLDYATKPVIRELLAFEQQ